ncbi:MAG TPA: PfkB family carbohydrate kinase [Acidisarcina sp.]|nr:PfkB family carbohydrate kinase [Acidisarcina sp.]
MAKRYDVLSVGVAAVDDMLYVSDYPRPNVKTPLTAVERHGGGPACTAVAAVGTLQGRSAYIARFGDDELSTYIKSGLLRRGVDTAHIIHDADSAPYHSFIVVDRVGSRNVFFDASMFKPIAGEDIPESLIQSAEIVLLDHVADPALIQVAEKVRNLHVPILGDIEGQTEDALRMANLADYLIVPEEFACWASSTTNPREACAGLSRTGRLATVVTSGAEGCYYSLGSDATITHVPAFPVQAFDTNGCGDTFHGAFALGIARGFSPWEAITFASAAAAIKASAAGGRQRGWDALPTLEDILRFLGSLQRGSVPAELLKKIADLQLVATS